MRVVAVAVALASGVPLVVFAHNLAGARFVARQTPPVTAPAGPPTPINVPISPTSTNPDAIPILSIDYAHTSDPASPISPTFNGGAQPTTIPNAPPLPDLTTVNFFGPPYPPLDKVPPIDSPEALAWIAQVMSSGIEIPNITQTVLGGCPTNPAAVNDPTRCWWTCGHCTRATDITSCPTKMTWGVTFDDGPGLTTTNLLDYLAEQDVSATFFVIGSRAISRPEMVVTEYMTGHQIGVHTWSHPYLTTLTNEEIIVEFGWTQRVIKDMLGVTPNTFRPPYGDIDDRVRAIAKAMGMTPVIWTFADNLVFDTQDFEVVTGTVSSTQVVSNFDNILAHATNLSSGFILLEHDLFAQTVDLAVGYTIPDGLAHVPKLAMQPVITCMGMPLANAYIETNNNAVNPPPNGTVVMTTMTSTSSSMGGGSAFTSSASSGSTPAHSSALSGAQTSGWFAVLLAVGMAAAFQTAFAA